MDVNKCDALVVSFLQLCCGVVEFALYYLDRPKKSCVCLYAGLLGEAPVTKPSLYAQLNVQCAILSVYLAAVAQQVTHVALCSYKPS